jgi:hypothetical protein
MGKKTEGGDAIGIKTVVLKFTLKITKSGDPEKFYFTVYDANGDPVSVTSGDTWAEAYGRMRDRGFRIHIGDIHNQSVAYDTWKIAR